MTELRPAFPGQFDEVYPLLREFPDSGMERDEWRRMLFDLPWTVEEPHRGYVLYDAGRAVGFLGTIFSRRVIDGAEHRFCNLSSWIVQEPYRSASLQLVLPVLALKGYTIVNFTASPAAHEVFVRLGFQPLEHRQVLITALGRPVEFLPGGSNQVLTEPGDVRGALDVAGQRIFDDMVGTRTAQVVLIRDGRLSHVVAARTPWKGSSRLAHVLYASDWELVWANPGRLARGLRGPLDTVGLRIDERHIHGLGKLPPFAALRDLAYPLLYRPASPALTPDKVDGIYSELVQKPW